MKILFMTVAYNDYLGTFYKKNKNLKTLSYLEHKRICDRDLYEWTTCWVDPLKKYGYEFVNITLNNSFLQNAWAIDYLESSKHHYTNNMIAIEQAKYYKPDILWFDAYNENLLKSIISHVPGIKLVISWCGSAINLSKVWNYSNLILSCAPETVTHFNENGLYARHLNHAFDKSILENLHYATKNKDITFIGQLVRLSDFHLEREKMLQALCKKYDISIHSHSFRYIQKQNQSAMLVDSFLLNAYHALNSLNHTAIDIKALSDLKRIISAQLKKVNPHLQNNLYPPVYGLDMYQLIQKSRISLNIHADSSPTYASNMRLFQITGVGTCMLTDWKKNISELFVPDSEIVAYKSVPECLDKASWLLSHPKEREKIARKGQARVLKEHTFENRAPVLDEIIKEALKKRK